jgi:hypothetical protein
MNAVRWPLLAEVMPECDFLSRHSRRVAAPPESVWRAVERYDPSRDASLPVRSLFRLRGLRVSGRSIRDALGGYGFAILAERPGQEIVFGTTGRFWAIRERANMEQPPDLDTFQAFDRPGWAKGAISIRVEPLDDGSTNLATVTSVQCVDEHARRRFVLYWALINVFSGWVRRDMLRAMARMAEKGP